MEFSCCWFFEFSLKLVLVYSHFCYWLQYKEEQNAEEHNGEEGSQEEAVVVDADSTDGAVLVNGNEAEEEWGTNIEGTPSA